MLNPQGQTGCGQLHAGNSATSVSAEAYMDWNLIYRTRQDMVDLTMEIEESQIRDLTLVAEENRNIIFLRLTKQ